MPPQPRLTRPSAISVAAKTVPSGGFMLVSTRGASESASAGAKKAVQTRHDEEVGSSDLTQRDQRGGEDRPFRRIHAGQHTRGERERERRREEGRPDQAR